MAKVCRIKFGSDFLTADGKNIEKEQEKEVARVQLAMGRELNETEIEIVKEKITSQREAEKTVLRQLLNAYANSNKDLDKYNLVTDIIRTIREADESFTINREEMKWFKEGFKKIPKDIPAGWNRCSALMEQLSKPEEIELPEPQTEGKKNGTSN